MSEEQDHRLQGDHDQEPSGLNFNTERQTLRLQPFAEWKEHFTILRARKHFASIVFMFGTYE